MAKMSLIYVKHLETFPVYSNGILIGFRVAKYGLIRLNWFTEEAKIYLTKYYPIEIHVDGVK